MAPLADHLKALELITGLVEASKGERRLEAQLEAYGATVSVENNLGHRKGVFSHASSPLSLDLPSEPRYTL
jgi:hypothetical protein